MIQNESRYSNGSNVSAGLRTVEALGNNIIEKTSTPWPNKFNDCKDMCGIIMLQLTMSRNVAATQTVTTFCP